MWRTKGCRAERSSSANAVGKDISSPLHTIKNIFLIIFEEWFALWDADKAAGGHCLEIVKIY
jgi:hypothetical protein